MNVKKITKDDKKLKTQLKFQIHENKNQLSLSVKDLEREKKSYAGTILKKENSTSNDFVKEYGAISVQKQIDRNKRLDDAFVVYSD